MRTLISEHRHRRSSDVAGAYAANCLSHKVKVEVKIEVKIKIKVKVKVKVKIEG